MVSLDSRLDGIVGGKTAKALGKAFEMRTVRDLLWHIPRRLEDKGELTDLSRLRVGEHATVLARVESVNAATYLARGRRATRTEVIITDGAHRLVMTFFRQPWQAKHLRPGTVGFFSGKVDTFRDRIQFQHPTYELLGPDTDSADPLELTDEAIKRWWPIYPATAQVSSKTIGKAVERVLDVLGEVPDILPDETRDALGLVTLDQALRAVHQPADREDWQTARHRLAFDEAFLLQVALAMRRWLAMSMTAVARPHRSDGLLVRFDDRLPFELTPGQRQVGDLLRAELAAEHPMHRLLQGEVGSGKTVVALRAMLQVVDAGGQAVLLAPTEVLAGQHHRSVVALMGDLAGAGTLEAAPDATAVALLTGSTPAGERRAILNGAASGAIGLLIGTHALLEESVAFRDLGLLVVDEQHRFGVEQRAAIVERAGYTPPHVLVMTATPIPRTVAMTVFGDLDVSSLHDLPAGRVGTQTTVVPAAERPDWLARAWGRVREEVEKGRQAYVVCPRIGGEPDAETADPPDDDFVPRRAPLAVADVAAQLLSGPLSGLRLYMLHGRLGSEEKDDVMRRFAAGDIDVLVCTTVIEVGVDVPNASVIVVLDAERFGVSQLHQLRGRVGRGSEPGLCLLVTDAPEASPSRARLSGVAATTDGFALADLDLRNRREGDVLGAAQSGRRSSLRLLSVLDDAELIATARETATALVEGDPLLDRHPLLAAEVERLVEQEQAGYMEKS